MAIVIEEEKSRVSIAGIGGLVIFVAVVAAAVYYIFFAAPELVPVPLPQGYEDIAPAAGFNLNPENVLAKPPFTDLQMPAFPLPTPGGPAPVGRANPFVAP